MKFIFFLSVYSNHISSFIVFLCIEAGRHIFFFKTYRGVYYLESKQKINDDGSTHNAKLIKVKNRM